MVIGIRSRFIPTPKVVQTSKSQNSIIPCRTAEYTARNIKVVSSKAVSQMKHALPLLHLINTAYLIKKTNNMLDSLWQLSY